MDGGAPRRLPPLLRLRAGGAPGDAGAAEQAPLIAADQTATTRAGQGRLRRAARQRAPARPRRHHVRERRLRPHRRPVEAHGGTACHLRLRSFGPARLHDRHPDGRAAVGGLLVAAGFAAVDPDIALTREDQDYKQAYGAAEAGLQWYLNRLGKDNNYYVNCTNVPAAERHRGRSGEPGGTGPGTDPRIWRKMPRRAGRIHGRAAAGARLRELRARTTSTRWSTRTATCASASPGARAASTRSVMATLRRRNFIDFIYFTDFETLDPAAYSDPAHRPSPAARATATSARAAAAPRSSFTDNDDVYGPFHTNDNVLVCGYADLRPHQARPDRDQRADALGPRPTAADQPRLMGTLDHPAGPLEMPPSNAALEASTLLRLPLPRRRRRSAPGADHAGRHQQHFGDQRATRRWRCPRNGVIYVETSPGGCTGGYDRDAATTASQRRACGNVWVKGNYSTRPHDRGRQRHRHQRPSRRANTTALLLGLIANNFVRVYHPVTRRLRRRIVTGDAPRPPDPGRDPRPAATRSSWTTGAAASPTGDLTVDGAIAQKFRGPVGTGQGRLDQHRLPQGLRVQRPAALPRAAVLPRPGPGVLAGRAPERAGAGDGPSPEEQGLGQLGGHELGRAAQCPAVALALERADRTFGIASA